MADYLTSDGARLNVEVAGPRDAATVVLVHGLAASIELAWRASGVLRRLADAGLRTVAYDARAHGKSDAPHEGARYGDDRVAADLSEIVSAFAGPDAILAGYSMGSSTILVALVSGLQVRGAVVGALPSAVLGWTAADEAQKTTAVAVLEGRVAADVTMQWWIDFLDATGVDKLALAAFLRGHRPVIEQWDAIATPVVVAAGVDDVTAASTAEVVSRLRNATALDLAGDHLRAAASPDLTTAVIQLALTPRPGASGERSEL
jgi:pimeloyl-ACP methyl ester carboxylesterase